MKTDLATTAKCFNCGKTLPVNENGIPVTSVFRGEIHAWFCPDCKFKSLDLSLAVGSDKANKQ